MKHISTAKASPTHNAYWFKVSREDLDAVFGKREIDSLIGDIGNGKTSVSNMSLQTGKGSMQHAEVQLSIEYHDWVATGKPANKLDFYAVTFGPQFEPINVPR